MMKTSVENFSPSNSLVADDALFVAPNLLSLAIAAPRGALAPRLNITFAAVPDREFKCERLTSELYATIRAQFATMQAAGFPTKLKDGFTGQPIPMTPIEVDAIVKRMEAIDDYAECQGWKR